MTPTLLRWATAGRCRAALAGLVLLACLPLAGCMQADSLGDQPPDEVRISGQPSWSNGIAQLMALKCAVCHQQPPSPVAPLAVPADLDLRQQNLAGTTRGAENVILAIRAGILHQDLSLFPRMPLPYATPLTPGEQGALETWAALTAPPDVAGGTTPAAGLTLYATYCQGCHGVHGGSPFLNISATGADPAVIQTLIGQAVTAVFQMQTWPLLPALTPVEQQAIANYLTSP